MCTKVLVMSMTKKGSIYGTSRQVIQENDETCTVLISVFIIVYVIMSYVIYRAIAKLNIFIYFFGGASNETIGMAGMSIL